MPRPVDIRNLLKDPSFELDPNALVSNAGEARALVTDFVRTGSIGKKALRITNAATDLNGWAGQGAWTQNQDGHELQPIVEEGQVYTGVIRSRFPTTRLVTLEMNFYDEEHLEVGSFTIAQTFTGGEYTTHIVQGTAPIGAHSVEIGYWDSASGYRPSEVTYHDDWQIVDSDTMPPYFTGDSLGAHWVGQSNYSLNILEGSNAIADRIYEEIAPLTYDDESLGYPLLHFIIGWTRHMRSLESFIRDSDGEPGWATVLDPDRAPYSFLNWLSLLVGSKPIQGETEQQARNRIKAMTGLRRGSPASIRGAAQRRLTGNKTVIFNERHQGFAYRLSVLTLGAETPDPDGVYSEILQQKPAGIVLTYEVIDDISYGDINAAYGSYSAVLAETDYPTYGHMLVNPPTP